ncbi:MAG: LLM class flavin-dependent oxidoreductase [Solirubrobacteraceae bacterium]
MSALAIGYLLPTQDAAGAQGQRIGELIELGVRAEDLGFEAVWVPDSPFQYGLPDPLVVLAALAARTRRITLATGVLLAGLRQSTLLAQQLASLDALAGGRLRVGLGAGFPSPDSERQFAAAGVAFATRTSRLEESIALMRALWAAPGEPVGYVGAHVQASDVTLSPAPARTGGPPIWLAGAGARAVSRVGRLADGWLPYLPNPSAYASGWARVQEAATAAGRDRSPVPALYLTVALDRSAAVARRRLQETVERWYRRPLEMIASLQALYAGTPEGLEAHLEPYVQAGVRYIVVRAADESHRGLDSAGAIVERLAGLAP